MKNRRSMVATCFVVLLVLIQGCGQADPDVNTATPMPPTEPATATEPPSTEVPPTATPEPTATDEPTPTEEPTATTEPTEESQPTAPPDGGEGAALLEERCTVCHSLDPVVYSAKTREEWESTVERMISKGAQLTDDEKSVLIDYLAATYGG